MSMKKWRHLKIPFQEIKDATNNFENCIGKGGYGWVYKGELSLSGVISTVAVKRLNANLGQGLKEFLTEIELLSGQHHPNLISLIGYCDEGNEKIIVYEYAARGSLDQYIRHGNTTLTWLERLKVCSDAARGLDHLHSHVGGHQTIIHRDIKSANILLDSNWVAKLSDLGLSKLSLAGLDRSAVISHACGTPGYCEPEYIISGIVTKESDVYSFGMVLFEVLCGRLCNIKEGDDGLVLSAELAKGYYENGKLDEIVDISLREQMSPYSMNKFSEIAYRCLEDDREQRPPMVLVTKVLQDLVKSQVEYESKLKEMLKSQRIAEFDSDEYWNFKLPEDSEDIIKRLELDPPPVYTTKKELFTLLRNGVFFDKHWFYTSKGRFFSINDDGTKCEMLHPVWFLERSRHDLWDPYHEIRGPNGLFPDKGIYPRIEELNIRCKISTSTLSLGIMYAANLVFSFGPLRDQNIIENSRSSRWVWVRWRSKDLRISSAHFATEIANKENVKIRRLKTTLWHFVNKDTNAYFDIVLDRIFEGQEDYESSVVIHGLEFQPVRMKKHHRGIEGPEGVMISKEDVDWEKKIPSDCKDIIQRSDTHNFKYTNMKDLYCHLCAGILIDNGQKWFSLCKSTGTKCHMLPATQILLADPSYQLMDRLSLSDSRFKDVIKLEDAPEYHLLCDLDVEMLSSGCIYACYLVFKFVEGYTPSDNGCLLEVFYKLGEENISSVYAHLKLCEPLPLIKPSRMNKGRESWNIPKHKCLTVPKSLCGDTTHNWMEQRTDGWLEVILSKPIHDLQNHKLMNIKLRRVKGNLNGIIVQGIEFRPMKRDIHSYPEKVFPFYAIMYLS